MTRLHFRLWPKKGKEILYDDTDEYEWKIFSDGPCVYRDEIEMSEDDYIIMQSTGLTDKKGVGIFEGDIVKLKTENHVEIPIEFIGDVHWDEIQTSFTVRQMDEGFIWMPWYMEKSYDTGSYSTEERLVCFCHEEAEIIGNIHLNPDLLPYPIPNADS